MIKCIPEDVNEELFESKMENCLNLSIDTDFTTDFKPPLAILQLKRDYKDEGRYAIYVPNNNIMMYTHNIRHMHACMHIHKCNGF